MIIYLIPDSSPLLSGGSRVRRDDHGVRLILYPRENLLIRLPPAHRPMIPFSHLHTTPDNKYGIKKFILSVRPSVHTIKKNTSFSLSSGRNFPKMLFGIFSLKAFYTFSTKKMRRVLNLSDGKYFK